MKWEKRADKEKQTVTPSISASALWCANCLVSPEWKQVPVRTHPPPCPTRSQPSPDWLHRCTAECPVMMLCPGLWGQCLAQGHFSSCYRGIEEHYMVGLSTSETQHKLSCFFLSTVRSKARHYVKLLMRPKYIEYYSMSMNFKMRFKTWSRICTQRIKNNRLTT